MISSNRFILKNNFILLRKIITKLYYYRVNIGTLIIGSKIWRLNLRFYHKRYGLTYVIRNRGQKIMSASLKIVEYWSQFSFFVLLTKEKKYKKVFPQKRGKTQELQQTSNTKENPNFIWTVKSMLCCVGLELKKKFGFLFCPFPMNFNHVEIYRNAKPGQFVNNSSFPCQWIWMNAT